MVGYFKVEALSSLSLHPHLDHLCFVSGFGSDEQKDNSPFKQHISPLLGLVVRRILQPVELSDFKFKTTVQAHFLV